MTLRRPWAAAILTAMLAATAAGAQAADLPAWLMHPAWKTPLAQVQASAGDGEDVTDPPTGAVITDVKFRFARVHQLDSVAIRREFYFSVQGRLAAYRLVPTEFTTENCDALLAAINGALGKPDKRVRDISTPGFTIDSSSWSQIEEGTLFGWDWMKAAGADGRQACHLVIRPYNTGKIAKKD